VNVQLFEGERIRLAALDPEKDAEVWSKWTTDPEYLRLLNPDPARPLAPNQAKKQLEELEKDAEKWKNQFHFALRERADDRLLGFVSLYRIEWNHRTSLARLGIGQAPDRGRGYGREALRMILRYAFDELNLHRVGALTFEYNIAALRLLERAGFVIEVRRREAAQREERRWAALMWGLLRDEWRVTRSESDP